MSPITSALVRAVLEQWQAYQWTIQGFGMVRTKIADIGRIHIWDSRLRTALVSDIHAHPWDLRSTIVSGELINQRFMVAEKGSAGLPYLMQTIATGEGGGVKGEPQGVFLDAAVPEFYSAGDVYEQAASEIHRSIPMDGTVTLLERQQGEPLQETLVFWPIGTSWVSAEPRVAAPWETERSVNYALARWHTQSFHRAARDPLPRTSSPTLDNQKSNP